jgi:carbamoyl-phosphate synthase large subunit
MSFTRYYWQLELDEQMRPTGREIVPGGPRRPA